MLLLKYIVRENIYCNAMNVCLAISSPEIVQYFNLKYHFRILHYMEINVTQFLSHYSVKCVSLRSYIINVIAHTIIVSATVWHSLLTFYWLPLQGTTNTKCNVEVKGMTTQCDLFEHCLDCLVDMWSNAFFPQTIANAVKAAISTHRSCLVLFHLWCAGVQRVRRTQTHRPSARSLNWKHFLI